MREVVIFNYKLLTLIGFIVVSSIACSDAKESGVSLTDSATPIVSTPSGPAPVASPKPQQPVSVKPPSADADPQASEQTNLTAGVELYGSMCARCHNPIDISSKRGVVALRIVDNYVRNFPTHKYNPWPSLDEANLIELALAIKKPGVPSP